MAGKQSSNNGETTVKGRKIISRSNPEKREAKVRVIDLSLKSEPRGAKSSAEKSEKKTEKRGKKLSPPSPRSGKNVTPKSANPSRKVSVQRAATKTSPMKAAAQQEPTTVLKQAKAVKAQTASNSSVRGKRPGKSTSSVQKEQRGIETKSSSAAKKKAVPQQRTKQKQPQEKQGKERGVKAKISLPIESVSAAETKPLFAAPSAEALKAFRRAAQQRRLLSKGGKVPRSTADFLAKPPAKGKKYSIDLRIHSPGTVGYFSSGGVDAGPALVRLSKAKGIDVIGLTDFYSAELVDTVQSSAAGSQLTILPGINIRCVIGSCRDVYCIVLFREGTTSAQISSVLDELGVPKEARGRRDYCLERDFGVVLQIIEKNGGMLIPSRIDKTPYRQLAINVLVEKHGIRAFDLVHPDNTDYFRDRWPDGGFTFFSFSNANALAQIGTRLTKVKLTSPTFEGIQELIARKPSL